MPELPEVERAVQVIRTHALGKVIDEIETNEDTIVFSGVSHAEFGLEVKNRKVVDVARYGKVFYIKLDGSGRMPVLHFGMTGNILVKGEAPIYYKDGPKKAPATWPPPFMKFILHLSIPDMKGKQPAVQIAFVDARRLGRIRLCRSPMDEPPISALGFDPILSMPDMDEFKASVIKRTCPIKALLLDQSFSAGVGNWVADEVLYHARIHPEQRCHTLTEQQVHSLHEKLRHVCQLAVDVNADASCFPDDWLFSRRWGKGKKNKGSSPLTLPSGEQATIKWITVGGRTSAYVVEIQKLNSTELSLEAKVEDDDDVSDLTPLSDEEPVKVLAKGHKRKRDTSGKKQPPQRRRKASKATTQKATCEIDEVQEGYALV